MQPKLKWIKHKGGIWTVPKFPFFTLVVKQCWNYNDRFIFEPNSYPWLYEHYPQTYKTLQEAQIACEKSMLNAVINMQKADYIGLKYSLYPGNIGCGRYDVNNNKHQWLIGGQNVVSKIYREHAIRFDITIPIEEVMKYAIKIHKRHCQRYIKAMQS